jgi:hypothetical protein
MHMTRTATGISEKNNSFLYKKKHISEQFKSIKKLGMHRISGLPDIRPDNQDFLLF